MSKAGVDLGSTLIKFAWEETGSNGKTIIRFATTANKGIKSIIKRLVNAGVTTLFATGINKWKEFVLKPLTAMRLGGDPIENEIRIQAHGARKLLKMTGKSEIKEFLLVSIGTGVSYTTVGPNQIKRFPFGNGIGGGFVSGILALAGISPKILADPGAIIGAKSLDLQVKNLIVETKGTFTGELIIAHFGRAMGLGNSEDIIKSALNCVATNIVRDILKQDMMTEEFRPPRHIVFIGSTVARCVLLENMLEKYFSALSKNMPNWNHIAIFPPHADFAGALGALLYGR
jgi:pantothenate kinase